MIIFYGQEIPPSAHLEYVLVEVTICINDGDDVKIERLMAFYNEVWCVVTFISYHQLFSLSLFFWRVSTDLSNLIVFQHISRLTFLLEVAYHTNVFQVWLETFCGKIQSRLHLSLRNETIIYITYIYISEMYTRYIYIVRSLILNW